MALEVPVDGVVKQLPTDEKGSERWQKVARHIATIASIEKDEMAHAFPEMVAVLDANDDVIKEQIATAIGRVVEKVETDVLEAHSDTIQQRVSTQEPHVAGPLLWVFTELGQRGSETAAVVADTAADMLPSDDSTDRPPVATVSACSYFSSLASTSPEAITPYFDRLVTAADISTDRSRAQCFIALEKTVDADPDAVSEHLDTLATIVKGVGDDAPKIVRWSALGVVGALMVADPDRFSHFRKPVRSTLSEEEERDGIHIQALAVCGRVADAHAEIFDQPGDLADRMEELQNAHDTGNIDEQVDAGVTALRSVEG